MFKVLKFIVISVVCLIIMGASVLYGFSSLFAPPNMDETLIPDAASQFYDINGNAIYTTLSEERRIPVTIDKIPKHVQRAFIAIEDNRFYEHGGIDYRGTARALLSTLSGHEVQGGSTITQQLAKNAFLTQERSIIRKIKEAFIAKELEHKYTKDEILTMYLNQIYFGQGAYGIESASMYYFKSMFRIWISLKLLLWQLSPKALTILILSKIRRKVKNVRSLLSTRWLNTVLSLLPTVMLPKQKSLSSAQHIKPIPILAPISSI